METTITIPVETVVKFNTSYVYFEKNGYLYRGKRHSHNTRHSTCIESHRGFRVSKVEKIKFTKDQCEILGLTKEQALKRWRI